MESFGNRFEDFNDSFDNKFLKYLENKISNFENIANHLADVKNYEKSKIINRRFEYRHQPEYIISLYKLYAILIFEDDTTSFAYNDLLMNIDTNTVLQKYRGSMFKILKEIIKIISNEQVLKMNVFNSFITLEFLILISLFETILKKLYISKDTRKGEHLLEVEIYKYIKDKEKYVQRSNSEVIQIFEKIINGLEIIEGDKQFNVSILKANFKKTHKKLFKRFLDNILFSNDITNVQKSKILYSIICLIYELHFDYIHPIDEEEYNKGEYSATSFNEYQRTLLRNILKS